MPDAAYRAPARVDVACLLALTFATGIVDALSWIGLSRVFTANMTGNVLMIGMGLAGGGEVNPLPPLCILAAFLIGAALVGRAAGLATGGWNVRTTRVFSLVAATLLILSAVSAVWPPHRFAPSALVISAVLAAAMGAQGAEATRLAVPQLTTVAVSSAAIGVGMSLLLGPSRAAGSGVLRRLLAIVLLAAGACVGAVLIDGAFSLGLLVAAVVGAAATAIGHRHRVRD